MGRKKKGKRRTRSPHPGVVLRSRKRTNSTTYFARFTDPDTGRMVDENLNKLGLTTAERRRA